MGIPREAWHSVGHIPWETWHPVGYSHGKVFIPWDIPWETWYPVGYIPWESWHPVGYIPDGKVGINWIYPMGNLASFGKNWHPLGYSACPTANLASRGIYPMGICPSHGIYIPWEFFHPMGCPMGNQLMYITPHPPTHPPLPLPYPSLRPQNEVIIQLLLVSVQRTDTRRAGVAKIQANNASLRG